MQARAQQGIRAEGSGGKLQQRIAQLQQMAAQQRMQGQPAWQQYDQQPPPRMPQQLHGQRIANNPYEAASLMEWQMQGEVGGIFEQEGDAFPPPPPPPPLSRRPVAGRSLQPAASARVLAPQQWSMQSELGANLQLHQTHRLIPRHRNQGLLSASPGARSDDSLDNALQLLKDATEVADGTATERSKRRRVIHLHKLKLEHAESRAAAALPSPPAPSSLLDPTETDLRALMTNTHLHTQLKDTPAKVQHGMASMMHHATVAAPVLRRNVALAAIDLHRTAAERMAVSGLSSSSDLVPPKHRSAIQTATVDLERVNLELKQLERHEERIVSAVEQLHGNSEGATNLAQEAQKIDATMSSLRKELAAQMGTATAEQDEEEQFDDFERQCGYALASGLLLSKLRGAVAELDAEEAATMVNRKRSHAAATAASRPPAAARRPEATRSNQLPQIQRKKQRREEEVEEIDDASPPADAAPSRVAGGAAAARKRARDPQEHRSAASSAARSTRQRGPPTASSHAPRPALPSYATDQDDDFDLGSQFPQAMQMQAPYARAQHPQARRSYQRRPPQQHYRHHPPPPRASNAHVAAVTPLAPLPSLLGAAAASYQTSHGARGGGGSGGGSYISGGGGSGWHDPPAAMQQNYVAPFSADFRAGSTRMEDLAAASAHHSLTGPPGRQRF